MGTRADFYLGRGLKAEWLGSIAWDGYDVGSKLLKSKAEKDFKENLAAFFKDRDDVTLPSMGWPWPWEDSQTTDYAYAFDEDRVWISCFGSKWCKTHNAINKLDDSTKEAIFPKMEGYSAKAGSKRSGIMVIGG